MGLLRRSSFVKLLGSYPAATTPVPDDKGRVSTSENHQEVQ
jgi:hypothetical protein